MAKIVIYNETDPDIGIVLEDAVEGHYGKCTQCGWPMHRWGRADAIHAAQRHVVNHTR